MNNIMVDLLENFNEKFRILFFCSQDAPNNIEYYRIKCFNIIDKIGEGGFGKVYLVEEKFSKEKFAMKNLKLSKNVDLKYIYKEVEALKKLSHKHIIKLFSYSIINYDKISLILEYGQGGTLGKMIKEQRFLSEVQAREYFYQILKAIDYCHTQDIIHRDLKPENIIFSDTDRRIIKVIDFGIAGLFKGEINKAGSYNYMSPEVISGKNYESHPYIDIWSLGCILYEMISGEKMFKGNSTDEKKENIMNLSFSIPSSISSEALDLILKMVYANAQMSTSMQSSSK